MDPSVGAYIDNNALKLPCGGHPRRYGVSLAFSPTTFPPQDTSIAGRGSYLSAGFDAPKVFGTGTASSADTYNAGAITYVATPASVQFPEPCSSAAAARDVTASKSESVAATSGSSVALRSKPTLGLVQFRGRRAVCRHILALRICTPPPPRVTVGRVRLSASAIAYEMAVVAKHAHLRVGSTTDMQAAVALSVLDSMLHQVALRKHLEPTLAQVRASQM